MDEPFKLERATFRSRDLAAFTQLVRNGLGWVLDDIDVEITIVDMDDRDGYPTVGFDIEGFILYKSPVARPPGKDGPLLVDGWALDGVVVTLPTREDPGDQEPVEIASALSDLDAVKMLIDAIVARQWDGFQEHLADVHEEQLHADIAKHEIDLFQSDSD